MANVPFTTSYLPKQWQQVLNMMLEKFPGDFNVKTLYDLRQASMQTISG